MTQRTPAQNRALHAYCSTLAQELNEAGYDFNDGKVVRLPVSFTGENVKKYMFKRVMKSLYPDKESTTELTTIQAKEVYENMNRFTAEHFGVSALWPTQENKGGRE